MIPDDDFKHLAENEAKRPEPTAGYVAKAFEMYLRSKLCGKGLIVLAHLEMLFAYHLELICCVLWPLMMTGFSFCFLEHAVVAVS